jgi:hypothetical protein
LNLNEEEILSEILEFIGAIKLDKEKFFNPELRENRSEIHTTFLRNIEDFFLKLSEDTDLLPPVREYKIRIPPEKGWKTIDGEEQYVELTEEERLDLHEEEYRTDIIVKNTSGQTLFHIEADSRFLEAEVPTKFRILPAKYKIWVLLPTGHKTSQGAINKFSEEVEKLKENLQDKNLICILKHPEVEPIVEKT